MLKKILLRVPLLLTLSSAEYPEAVSMLLVKQGGKNASPCERCLVGHCEFELCKWSGGKRIYSSLTHFLTPISAIEIVIRRRHFEN